MIIDKKILIESCINIDQLENFLHDIDNDFVPNLSERVSLSVYAKKLTENAKFLVALVNKDVIGMIAFYCNDIAKKMHTYRCWA